MKRLTSEIRRADVLKVFALLVVVAFLLRIFYAANLYQDDGLWFTAAEEIVRGKALYWEIYFDKPPVLPLVYALLFKLFGASILTIRLFTIFYSVAIAAALYRFGAWLYDKRIGLLAAAFFVVFSTTYTTGHFQGLNTDFLMMLPYTLGAHWLLRSRVEGARLALAGGVMVSIAFQTNPKAIFDLLLVFIPFSFYPFKPIADETLSTAELHRQRREVSQPASAISEATRQTNPPTARLLPSAFCLPLTTCGFLIGALPFWLWLAATHSLSDYWHSVWDWGTRYASYYAFGDSLLAAIRQSGNYFALNPLLLVTLLFVAAQTVRYWQKRRAKSSDNQAAESASATENHHNADVALLIWFLISYVGMSVGGRFFGHYFLQILPALCLIGARGIMEITAFLAPRTAFIRRTVLTLLIVGFLLTLIRFHTRTAILAADFLRGAKSQSTMEWFHERLNREERQAAAVVRDLTDIEQADDINIAALRQDSPRQRPVKGNEDTLFVWGYRPELYYWSGLLPASRYLSTQPLTGVPADVQFFGANFVPVLDNATTAAARAQLLTDLQQTPPKYIVDELGFYNSQLAMDCYPELKEFLGDYKLIGNVERFFVYRRRVPKEKNKH